MAQDARMKPFVAMLLLLGFPPGLSIGVQI
jgi:hypothetical protein